MSAESWHSEESRKNPLNEACDLFAFVSPVTLCIDLVSGSALLRTWGCSCLDFLVTDSVGNNSHLVA